ncbi:MAG: UDP-N-acetylglucosamine 2-epimerase (non-hydrolyzing) [Alphaproteobacteria bacterium]|nr:UDP-N-acetylglucosamine 2-epimerase (non-hydrolyzing) [Alphaproteobacteria bacterium]
MPANRAGKPLRILSVIGTRPEAIKMAPVVQAIASNPNLEGHLCVTAQHREMLDQVLAHFSLNADSDLDLMRRAQGLSYITGAVLEGMEPVLTAFKPDWVVVQGDTTTTMAASLAAFYQKIKVAHVEAGLRTGNIYSPWPEEMNRKITTQLATIHFPPTEGSRANLLAEGIPDSRIVVTGNTVIDALVWTRDKILGDRALSAEIAKTYPFLDAARRMILVTGHRRENFDGGMERIFRALATLAKRPDIQIVFPVHLNPVVQRAASEILQDIKNVHLIAPQPYRDFVWLMSRSYLIVTDSGGVQEEAPGLGKPVLVTRDTTERPEAVEAGTVELIGTDGDRLLERASALLDDRLQYERMSRALNPYGDGLAAERIVRSLINGSIS